MVGPKSNTTGVLTLEGDLDTTTDARGECHMQWRQRPRDASTRQGALRTIPTNTRSSQGSILSQSLLMP